MPASPCRGSFRSAGLFLEATGEVFAGTSAVFQTESALSAELRGPSARLSRISPKATNLDLGASVAFGPTDLGIHFPGSRRA